jgi:heme oxygenase
MLVGDALLEKARSLLKKSFYKALVDAKGYKISGDSAAQAATRGRQAEFRTRVHGNGNLLIGNAYTRRMGLTPGQEFRIQIHQETRSIWLLPLQEEEPA